MKQPVVAALRRLGLLPAAERARYRWKRLRASGANRRFRVARPEFLLPPPDLLYEVSGDVRYERHYLGGKYAADYIHRVVTTHLGTSSVAIAEWGCGVGRVVRHFPQFGTYRRVAGTDVDARMIAWCREHIAGVEFQVNAVEPPLPFEAASFDCIYAFSVFTHLTEDLHHRWIAELLRVVRAGGLVILTLNGEGSKHLLSDQELADYDRGLLVTRGEVALGGRLFGAYHSPAFVRRFAGRAEVIEFVPGERGVQDLWVLRAPAAA